MNRCLSLRYLRCLIWLWSVIVLTFPRSHESDSSSNVAWLMLSADCMLFTRIERCSCRVFPCPSICWGFFCCQWLRVLSTLFLCHRLAGFLLMLVAASLCGIIHCKGNQKIFVSLISKLILMLMHFFFHYYIN